MQKLKTEEKKILVQLINPQTIVLYSSYENFK